MNRLGHFNDQSFYGILPKTGNLRELTAEVRHGKRKGVVYSYIVFLDERGLIKWKIIPVITHRGKIRSLHLYHRNTYGNKGFHSQIVSAWGTPKGLRDLIDYIHKHEVFEKQ